MRVSALGLLPLSLAATAAANPLPPAETVGPSGPMFYNTPKNRELGALLLRHIGSCLYEKDPAAARALLRYVPGSKDEARWVGSFQSRLDYCVNGDAQALRSTSFSLRGAVAEGIFLAKFPTDPVDASAPADRPDIPASWMEAYRKDPSIAPILAMHQLAACVVRAAPVESSRLLRTTPGSAEESASFGAIAPHFGPCVNQGRTFSSDRTTLRSLIAEALYDRFVGVDDHPASAAQ